MATGSNKYPPVTDTSWDDVLGAYNEATQPKPTAATPSTANAHPDYVSTNGDLMVYNDEHEMYFNQGKATKLNTPPTTSGQPATIRNRQATVPFTHDMVQTIRGLRRNNFTLQEIAAYVRKQPGYERATDEMVRQRLQRGTVEKPPMREITDEMARRYRDPD